MIYAITDMLKDVFSRKLLSTLAGNAAIVALLVVLGQVLGPEVITETVLLAAIGGIVTVTLYQVTKQAQIDQNGSGSRPGSGPESDS